MPRSRAHDYRQAMTEAGLDVDRFSWLRRPLASRIRLPRGAQPLERVKFATSCIEEHFQLLLVMNTLSIKLDYYGC